MCMWQLTSLCEVIAMPHGSTLLGSASTSPFSHCCSRLCPFVRVPGEVLWKRGASAPTLHRLQTPAVGCHVSAGTRKPLLFQMAYNRHVWHALLEDTSHARTSTGAPPLRCTSNGLHLDPHEREGPQRSEASRCGPLPAATSPWRRPPGGALAA